LTGIVFKESQIPPTRQKQYPKNFWGKKGGGLLGYACCNLEANCNMEAKPELSINKR